MKRLFYIFVICLFASGVLGADYTILTTESTVDGDTRCHASYPSSTAACTSSDTLIIEGGARGSLLFKDFDGNGSYITIQNEDTDRVVITHDSQHGKGILSFENCKYIDVRGDNNSSFAWSSGCKSAECYGIKVVSDGNPNTPAGSVWVYDESDHIKLGYIDMDFTGALGDGAAGVKITDASLTNAWTFDTFEIHHNYIHDTPYSGMYLGHNKPHYTGVDQECANGCPYTASFSIHNNLLEDLGSYGITYKGVNGPDNYIYNNIVRTTGANANITDYKRKQGIGAQFFYSTYYAVIYGNYTENTGASGIQVGESDHIIYDNVIVGCGKEASTIWGNGITIFMGDEMPDRLERTAEIYDNIIVEAERYGIQSNNGAEANLYRNVITEAGIGEKNGTGLTEGTDTSDCDATWGSGPPSPTDCANVYNADTDNICFTTWSDDADYSNDDFSLTCGYPYTFDINSSLDGATLNGGKVN